MQPIRPLNLSASQGVEIVDKLINEEGSRWNVDAARRFLPPKEAIDNVLKINLSPGDRVDKLIWSAKKDGVYSVKSAYILFYSIRHKRNNGECSNVRDQQTIWKKIWKMQVPNIVKIFTWRAIKYGLPTLHNPVRKKVIDEAACKFCHLQYHALVYYPTIKPFW